MELYGIISTNLWVIYVDVDICEEIMVVNINIYDIPPLQWLKELTASEDINMNNTLEMQNRHFLKIQQIHTLLSLTNKDHGAGVYYFDLNISYAQPQDEGLYVCLGRNNRGYSYKEAYLTVLPGKYLTLFLINYNLLIIFMLNLFIHHSS